MRNATLTACGALLLIPSLLLAKSGQPVALEKVGAWELNYDQDSCHLFGEFGSGGNDTVINITRYQPGDSFDLTLYGPLVKVVGAGRTPVELAFGNGKPFQATGFVGNAGVSKPLLMFSGLRLDNWSPPRPLPEDIDPPTITPAAEAAITSITFKLPGYQRYRIETGSLGLPMAAMRECLSDLLETWGYDPSTEAGLRQRARPLTKAQDWIKYSDFPKGAIRHEHNGLVEFRLDVDSTGKVAGCHILQRTNPDEFADLSCKLLTKRASFSPALDKDGKPVKSFYINKVVWMTAG